MGINNIQIIITKLFDELTCANNYLDKNISHLSSSFDEHVPKMIFLSIMSMSNIVYIQDCKV